MKKFKFTLEKLLDYKDQVLETEKGSLSHLRAQKRELEAKIEAVDEEFGRVNDELHQKASVGITVAQMRGYEFQLQNMRYHLDQLHKEDRILARAIENQLKVVVAASQEVSGLDKLKEKQMAEYKYQVAKDDELVISEYISSKIIRGSGEL